MLTFGVFALYAMVPVFVSIYVYRQVTGVLGILDVSLDRSETSRTNRRRMREDLQLAISGQTGSTFADDQPNRYTGLTYENSDSKVSSKSDIQN